MHLLACLVSFIDSVVAGIPTPMLFSAETLNITSDFSLSFSKQYLFTLTSTVATLVHDLDSVNLYSKI